MPWKFGFPSKKLKKFCKFSLSPPPPPIPPFRLLHHAHLFSIPPLIKKIESPFFAQFWESPSPPSLQHVRDVIKQKIKCRPIRTREIDGVRLQEELYELLERFEKINNHNMWHQSSLPQNMYEWKISTLSTWKKVVSLLQFYRKLNRSSERNILALADSEVKTERVERCIDTQS